MDFGLTNKSKDSLFDKDFWWDTTSSIYLTPNENTSQMETYEGIISEVIRQGIWSHMTFPRQTPHFPGSTRSRDYSITSTLTFMIVHLHLIWLTSYLYLYLHYGEHTRYYNAS